MKKLILICLMISAIYTSKAQCISDAGPDKVVCNPLTGIIPLQIGGTPSAVAGTPPFTYTWETVYVDSFGTFSHTYYASDFLDDTTLANPTFINPVGDSLYFILTVTDNNSNVCKDTVLIRVSYFYIHLGYLSFTINQGDSIFLNYGTNIESSTPPFEYLWQPNHGLNDSTSLSFWAKPDSSVAYYVTITDSAGCTATGAPYYWIHVLPVSVEEINKLNIEIYPNPTTDFIKIRKNINDKITLTLYNIEGKLLHEFGMDVGLEEIKLTPQLENGFYFYKIMNEKGNFSSGKLVKQ